MVHTDYIYKSILNQLSLIPTDYLQEIDNYLRQLTQSIAQKEQRRLAILQFAGAWSDMEEEEFEDFLNTTRNIRQEMFIFKNDIIL